VYRSEGDITITGDPVYEDGEWKHPALTQGGRTFKVAERFITSSTPAPAASPTGLSPAQEARATPEQKARAAKKPKQSPPSARRAFGKGAKGGSSYANFQSDTDADAYDYAAKMGKAMSGRNLSDQQMAAEREAAKNKLARVSAKMGIPEAELRSILTYYTAAVREQAKAVAVGEAFTPPTLAEFIASQAKAAPVEARPEPAQTQARPQGGQTEEAKEFRRVTNQSIQLGELAQQSRDAKVARQTEAEQRLQSLSDADLLGMDKNELNDLHADLTRGLGHPYPDKQVLLRQLNKLRQPAQAGQEEASQPAPAAKPPEQMTPEEWRNNHFDENEDRGLPADYFADHQFNETRKNKTQVSSVNGIDFLTDQYGGVHAFDGEKNVGYGDGKAFVVEPAYQRRGIGTEIIAIAKKELPTKRIGSQTAAGQALVASFHKRILADATKANSPVNAAAVDAYGIALPEGYTREGDLYVYRPAPSPAPASQLAGQAEATSLEDGVFSYLQNKYTDKEIIEIATRNKRGAEIVRELKKEGLITKSGEFKRVEKTDPETGEKVTISPGRDTFEFRWGVMAWELRDTVEEYEATKASQAKAQPAQPAGQAEAFKVGDFVRANGKGPVFKIESIGSDGWLYLANGQGSYSAEDAAKILVKSTEDAATKEAVKGGFPGFDSQPAQPPRPATPEGRAEAVLAEYEATVRQSLVGRPDKAAKDLAGRKLDLAKRLRARLKAMTGAVDYDVYAKELREKSGELEVKPVGRKGSILFINPEKLIDRLTAKHATTEAAREGMDTFILHEFIHKAAIGNMDGAKIIGLYNLLTPEAKAASKALYLSDSGLTDFWQDDKEFAAAHEWFAQLVEARLRGKISNQAEIEASQDPAFRDRLLALLRDFVAQLRDIAKLVTDKAQAARIEAEADAVQAIVADMAAKAGLEIQAGPEAAGLINTRPLEEAERNARKRLESLQYPSVGGGKSADKVDKLRKEYAQEKASRQADLDTASAKLKAAYAQNEAQPAPQAKPAQASQTDEADKALAEAFTGLFLPPSGLRLKQTRAQLIKATEDSSDWKDWYQRHEDTLTEFFGVDADLFQRILSVTSQAASVKANVGLALKAYVQLKTGAPFEGYLPAVIKNLQRVKDAAQVQGQKIAAYQQANTGADEVVVVDRHISRMLFGVDSPTAKQFQKGQQVLTQIANVLGWQPRQVQAAMWAASIRKAGNTPESYDSYLRELNKRGTLNDRIGSVVPTGIQNQRSGGSGGLDSTGSNQASLRLPPQGSLEQTDLPRDRRDAMMKAASVLVDAGVKTPAELAARLDKLAPGGQLRQYSRAFWRLMTGFDSTLEEKPDWQAVYQASPAPVAAKADQTLWADLSRFFASENSDGSRAAALKDLKAGTASDDAKGYLIDLLANPNYKGTAKSLAPQLIARLKATMPPATSPEAPTTAEANVPVTAEMVSKWFRAYYGGNAPVTKVLPGLFKIGDSLYGLYSVNKLTDQQVLNGVPFGDSQMLIKEEETAEEVPALPASVTPAQAEAVAEEAAMPEPAKQAAPFDAAAAKGQKKFLLAEVAAAVKAAPKRADMTQEQKDAITNLEDKFRNWDSLNEEERKTYASELAAAKADAERLIGYVTIEVPGDGTFTILNEKEALYRFQKKADKFPVSQAKDDLPAKPTAQAPTAVPALKKAKTTADVVAAVFPMVSTDTTRGEGLQKVKGEGAYLWATNGRFAVRVEHENGGGKGQEAIVYDEKGNAQPWPEGEQNPTMEAIIPDDKAFTPYTLDTARWFSLMSQARAIIKELPNESSTASKAVSLYRNPDGSLGLFASDINRGDYAHNIQPEAKILAAYSPDYFQTVLRVARNLGNEQIELRIGDDVSPATLRAGKALFVLMPMRVNGAPAYSTARPAPPVTAEASPAAPKAAKPRPMNMAGQVRPEKKKAEKFTLPPQEPFKPTAERFAQFYRDYSIPEDVAVKNGEKMMEAIETGEWTNLLHPDNKRSRAIWEAWTRQKLPAGVKASEDAFAKFITEYHATSNPVADLTEEELGRELLRLGPLALKPYASPATKARALALAQENQRRLASASPAAEPPAQPGQTREEAAEAARVFAGKDPSLPPPAPDDLETLQALRDRANRKPYKPDKLTPARLAVGIRAGWVTKTKEAKLTEKGYSQLSEWEQQQNAHERALGAIADKLVDEAVSKWDRENDPTSWEAINAAKQAAAQPGQEAAQPAQAPAPEGQGGQVKPITGFDSARAFIAQLRKGEVTAEQVRTAWAQLKAQRPAILADLNKMKVDELLPMAGMSARKSDGKASIAESVLSTLDLYFNPDDSISYSYGGDFQANKDAAMDEKVAKWTDEMIVEQAKARREAAEASKAAKEKALTNPETPEEWDRFVWSTGRKAMSEAEVKEVLKLKSSQARNDAVRKKGESVLTPEQLAAYDAVRGIDRKAQEQARTEAKARVYGVASGVEADIIETKHTQKGHDLFVVKLSERVERPVYDSLNAASKKLGGYYSSYAKGGAVPGFQFTTRAAAENFIAVSKGETVDQKEQIQERQEAKKSATASRLTAVAEVLDGKADGILNADRKTNTAKRAREAAGQEATARGMKAMAQTMRNLAAAMESGEATHLDGVRMGTHVETLDGMARGAMTYWIRDRKMGMMDREKTEAGGPTAEMMDATRIPYPYLDKGDILRLVEKGRETPGAKLLAERVAKIRMNENEGQAVTLRSDSEMDDVKELAQKVTERGKPVWDTIKWKYETYDRLKAMGLTNLPSLRAALREFLQYRGQAAKEDPIKKMERELVGMKLPGFFPTPRAVIDEMVGIAGIEPGMKVLEPSAGKGDIAEAMQEAGAEVDAIELSNRLRDILTAKGVNVIDNDFTSVEPEPKYDAVVMNPPFENGQDMEHIRHAYKFLKPGGKLVAIMSAGPFYRQDKQATAFREWLDSVGGSHEAMPEGSFAGSDAFRQTGVRTQMVTITKPADEGQPASLALPPAGQAVTAGRDATDTETLYQRLLKKYDEEIDPRPVADFDADQSPITVEFAGKKWEISIRDKTFLAEDVEDSDNGYNAHLDKELTVYQDASWGNVPRNISDIWEEAPGSWWQVPTVDSKDRDTWDAEQPYYAVETNDGESGWMDEEQVTLSLHDAVKMYVKESSEDKRLVYYTGDTTRGKDRFGDWDDIPKLEILAQPSFVEKLQRDFPGMTREEAIDIAKTRNTDNTDTFLVAQAYARHNYTDYDDRLKNARNLDEDTSRERSKARFELRESIQAVMERWTNTSSDESGQVIPLSERFNPASQSILRNPPAPEGGPAASQEASQPEADEEADPDLAAFMAEQQRLAEEEAAAREALRNDPDAIDAVQASGKMSARNLSKQFEYPEARAVYQALTAARDQLGGPETVQLDKLREWAKKTFESDPEKYVQWAADMAEESKLLDVDEQAVLGQAFQFLTREARLTGDKNIRALLNKVGNYYLDTGTRLAQAMSARRDPLESPQERWTKALDIVFGPSEAVRRKLRILPTQAGKARRIASLEAELAEARGSRRADVEAALKTARAQETKEELLEKDDAESEKIKQAVLKNMGVTEDDLMLSGTDRVALQSAILDLPAVKEGLDAYKGKDNDGYNIMRLAFRGFSDEHIANYLNLNQDDVGKFIHDATAAIIRPAVAAQVKAGTGFGGLIKAGFARLKKAVGLGLPPKIRPLEDWRTLIKGKKQTLDQVTAEVNRVMGYALQSAKARNSRKLMSKVINTPNGQKVRVFVPFDPDDMANYYAFAREYTAAKASAFDKVYEYWINWPLLSGPQTQVANITGNAAQVAWHYTGQRLAEATLNLAYQDPNSAQFREFKHILKGFWQGIGPAFEMARETFLTEGDTIRHKYLGQPLEIDVVDGDLDKVGNIRASVGGQAGRISRLPGRVLRFTDAFFKTAIMYAEASAVAYRRAHVEAKRQGLKGQARAAFIDTEIANTLNDTSSAVWGEVMKTAEELLFQDDNSATEIVDTVLGGYKGIKDLEKLLAEAEAKGDSDLAAKLQKRIRSRKFVGSLMRWIFPFQRTPTNIVRTGIKKAGGSAISLLYGLTRAGWLAMGKKGVPVIKSYPKAMQIKDASETLLAGLGWLALASMLEGDDNDDEKPVLLVGTRSHSLKERAATDQFLRKYGGENSIVWQDGKGKVLGSLPFGRYEPAATLLTTWIDAYRNYQEVKRLKSQGENASYSTYMLSSLVSSLEDKSFLQGFANAMQFVRDVEEKRENPDQSAGVKMLMNNVIPNLIKQPLRNMDDVLRERTTAGPGYAALPNPTIAPKLPVFAAQPKISTTGERLPKAFTPPARLLFQANTKVTPQPDALLYRANRLHPTKRWSPQPLQRDDYNADPPGKAKPVPIIDPAKKRQFAELAGRLYAANAAKVAAKAMPSEKAAPGESLIKAFKKAREDAMAAARAQAHAMGLHKATATP
jgi:GNAT superfamily N-acetyltransferase/SAM-dependent methyltransferase